MVTRGCRFAQIFGKRQMAARPEMRHADILEVFELSLVRVHPPNIFSFIVRQLTLSQFGLNCVVRVTYPRSWARGDAHRLISTAETYS